jgi:hypothetical protein
MHQNDDYIWYRASGDCRCEHCGLLYREHYNDVEHGEFDKRLCNGDIVHL